MEAGVTDHVWDIDEILELLEKQLFSLGINKYAPHHFQEYKKLLAV